MSDGSVLLFPDAMHLTHVFSAIRLSDLPLYVIRYRYDLQFGTMTIGLSLQLVPRHAPVFRRRAE